MPPHASAAPDSQAAPHRPSRARRSRIWNIVLAVFFFVLGVIGLVIPVMPQILFFAMSLFFLSLVSPPVRRAVRRWLHRHPKLAHRYNAWRHRRRQKRLVRIRKSRELAARLHLRKD
ncbi:MAG: DUF454 family protein [Thermoanaerobaculia bacterium]